MQIPKLSGAMFLGAQRVRGDAGEITGTDPRSGKPLRPTYGLASKDQVSHAAQLAGDAFRAYRETDLHQRAEFLDRIAENIDSIANELVQRVELETGIVEPQATRELTRTTGQLRIFAELVRDGSWLNIRIDSAIRNRAPLPRPDIRTRRIPIGPVAVFGASNFPLAFSVAGGDTASALAAGCPVVVKAHSAHPGVSELVAEAVTEAAGHLGLPAGVFSLIYGSGKDAGIALVRDPRIRAVGFTGSRNAGRALVAAAASRPEPIPVYAEMSSINPVFLLPGALSKNIEDLGRSFVASLTFSAGQLCTNPGLLFAVDSADLETFIRSARAELDASGSKLMLNASIANAFASGVERLAGLPTITDVATGPVDVGVSTSREAHIFEATAEAFLLEPIMQQEVFGSSALIIRLPDAGSFVNIADALEGQLTATIHAAASDHSLAAEMIPILEEKVGRIIFNGWPTGVEVTHSMVHGGPFPATSDGRSTSVGTMSIDRFLRPVAYQSVPASLLPRYLAPNSAAKLWRLIDGEFRRE